MFASLLGLVGIDLKREVRAIVVTAVLALTGAFLAILAIGIALRAFYLWLELLWGTFPAMGILGVLSAVLASVLFFIAFRSRRAKPPPAQAANPLNASASSLADAGEQAMHQATDAIRKGSRTQVYSTILIAAMAGLLLGRRL